MSDSSHDAKDTGAADESNSTAAEDPESTETPPVPKKPESSPSAAPGSAASSADSGAEDPNPTARFAPGWNQDNQPQSQVYGSGPQTGSPHPGQAPSNPGLGSTHPSQGPLSPGHGSPYPAYGSRIGQQNSGQPISRPNANYPHAGSQPGEYSGSQPSGHLGGQPQGIPYPQPPQSPQASHPPQPTQYSQSQMSPSAAKYLPAFGQGTTWRSALIPPGLALLAGIIVSIIVSALLTSMGDFTSLAENTGFNTDGISYALPFVLLAMSLFGSAVFRFSVQAGDMGQASGSLFASGAPLLITIIVIGVLWWFTKRSELKSPSPNRGVTWIRIGITTLSMALVLLLLELIFAARFSITDSGGVADLEFSAVTVRSFFLPLLVIFVTSICARIAGHFKGSEAIGAPFLRWLVPSVLVTWTHLVVTTLALSVVAIFLIPLSFDMPWQTIPAIFINVGLILTMLVHFGGVSASAQGDMMGYDSGGFSESLTIFSREAPGQLWIGLLAVVAAVLAATLVATVTRRPYWTVVGEDKQQWTAAWKLPLAFCAVWGLLSVLAVPLRVHLEGSAAAASMLDAFGTARAGVGPLAWSFLIFALWGAVIEVLSRTLGPRLVLTVPALAKFFAGRAVHPHWGQALSMSEPHHPLIHPDAVTGRGSGAGVGAAGVAAGGAGAGSATYSSDPRSDSPAHAEPGAYPPAGAPYPMSAPPTGADSGAGSPPPPGTAPAKPFDKKKATLVGVISGSAILAIVAALIVVTQVNGHMFGPEATVEKYFSELSDGDAEDALKMADVDVPSEQRQLLANDILGAAKALPKDVTVEDAEINGNSATVSATYDVGGSKSTTSFSLHKAGKKALFFDDWKLQAPELFYLSVETPGLSKVKVNGIDIDTVDSGLALPAFPGMYSIGLAEETDLVSADEIETRAFFANDADMEGYEPALLAAQPTDAFRAEVNKQVKTLIDSCAKKTVAQPDGCPFGSYSAESYDATNIKWSISSYPTAKVGDSSGEGYFDPEDSTGPNGGPAWPISTETTGEAFVTGKYDSFFDESDTFDDTVTFSVDGTAEIVDGKVVINIEGDPYGF
ncbi:hypothetical protein BANT918_00577 [Brevibacterium antiquum CNRZ 918]|uniref:Uncharacterized protein n=2 Tax=Brevibacteriaceae TaxID=85019 RepID=A0A2H1I5D8_9MICO|nr:hypothetical protein BANT918_00577 [Brevibacterium antiquum CNRZ 918]